MQCFFLPMLLERSLVKHDINSEFHQRATIRTRLFQKRTNEGEKSCTSQTQHITGETIYRPLSTHLHIQHPTHSQNLLSDTLAAVYDLQQSGAPIKNQKPGKKRKLDLNKVDDLSTMTLGDLLKLNKEMHMKNRRF